MDELDESQQSNAVGVYHRRIIHFLYAKNTHQYNKLHHDALWNTACIFMGRIFGQAGALLEGETHELKKSLIEATEIWQRLMGDGVPCPVVFELEDLHQTKELSAKLQVADENAEGLGTIIGFDPGTWVSNEDFKKADELAELIKLKLLMAISEKEVRVTVEKNWFLNDMDEDGYM